MVGHITVEKIEEHEDGSATVVFECDYVNKTEFSI